VSFAALLMLAVGLAMDATAVAVTRGALARRIGLRDAALVAVLFGGSQALMPVGGWFLGTTIGSFIERWDHWVTFAVLVTIGGKMLWESRGAAEAKPDPEPFRFVVLVGLAIATSIDAFAVGITLPMLGVPLVTATVTIGVVTALASIGGLLAGRRFGALLGRRFDAVGGIVLVAIGTKVLVEHLLDGH
jgi:putative Mn2+ efflux pump MntP